jgi:hypothetical protein
MYRENISGSRYASNEFNIIPDGFHDSVGPLIGRDAKPEISAQRHPESFFARRLNEDDAIGFSL